MAKVAEEKYLSGPAHDLKGLGVNKLNDAIFAQCACGKKYSALPGCFAELSCGWCGMKLEYHDTQIFKELTKED